MSVVSRRQREKEQRRKDIINAAEKLFFDRSYDNVSMNDIAKEVELSKATLYLYFDNKEALFFIIVLRGVRILNTMIKEKVDERETGIEKLIAFRKAYTDFVSNYSDYFKVYSYFQSGRFDLESIVNNVYLQEFSENKQYSIIASIFPPPCPSFSEYAIDIINLGKEIFDLCCDSIKKGVEDDTIQSNVNPVELTVLLILLSESTANIRPDMMKELESNGINKHKFA
ncbi:MAG: TetR/AcrR family transcriptional regulator, partial [Methanobacterium sp.]